MRIVNFFYRIWTRIVRASQRALGASTIGVRAMVIRNADQEILLVRHTYMNGWHFPGGGVKLGETANQAVVRELYEEAGIIPLEKPSLFSIYHHCIFGVNDYPILFVIKKFMEEKFYSPEISESKWFSITELPEDIDFRTLKRIEEYFIKKEKEESW